MNKIIRISLTALMALVVVSVAAQPNHRRHHQRSDSTQRGGHMMECMVKELSLTDAQQKEIRDLHGKLATERPLPLRSKTERGVRPTEKQIEEHKAEMDKFDEKMKSGMKKILSEEQFTKWETIRANHHNRNNRMGGMGKGVNQGRMGACCNNDADTCRACGRPFNN